MYGNRDNEYFREALNNTDSYLYKKICKSGPVVTFRLLVSENFDLRSGIAVHRVEPTNMHWSTTGLNTPTIAAAADTGKRGKN